MDQETPVVVIEETPVAAIDLTPVATCLETPLDSSDLTPVVPSEPAPIVPGRKPSPAPPAAEPPLSASAVDTWLEDRFEATTVVTSPSASLPRLWISDSGEIVPQSRVRRVQAAADALSTGEQALYNLLWTLPTVRQAADNRGVQAGYDSLTKATGFSRKTIQRTVDRLIAKHYIEIETPADIYRRTSTVYRVFGPRAVLERLIHRGCTHIAKIGPGVAFVSPLSGLADHSRTVDTSEAGHCSRYLAAYCGPFLNDTGAINQVTTVGGIQESPPKYQIFLRPTAAAYRTPTENGRLAAGRSIVLQRKFRPHPGTPHRGREAPHPRYYRTVTEICPIRLHSAHSLSLREASYFGGNRSAAASYPDGIPLSSLHGTNLVAPKKITRTSTETQHVPRPHQARTSTEPSTR